MTELLNTKTDQAQINAKSTKISDPNEYFAKWHFRIDAHHYWTLGVELKTFVKTKVRYKSWAYMTPGYYNFLQGHIFYSQSDCTHFLQVGAEQGLFGIEVFEGHRNRSHEGLLGWITTCDDLAKWLQTGCRPLESKELDLSLSKSGLMAWQMIPQALSANEPHTNAKTATLDP